MKDHQGQPPEAQEEESGQKVVCRFLLPRGPDAVWEALQRLFAEGKHEDKDE